jgi:thymidine kinase
MSLLHYYQGSMYAGKSTKAVQHLFDAKEYDQRIIVSPSWFSRGFLSRNHPKECIDPSITLLEHLDALSPKYLNTQQKSLIVVDEVQFCPPDALLNLLELCASSSQHDLIVAGLQVGQHGQPFSNNALLERFFAQQTTRLYATCALCAQPKGLVAVRKWLLDDYIKDEYSLMCKCCFDKFFAYGRGNIAIPDPLFHR